jgi:ribosome-binding protein aMBF1 (putative translation factor)
MSTPASSKFSDRLRAARELRKLSQSELAERAGLQPSAVSHFETGRRAPSFDNLKRLADALHVTTDYLLGRVDEPRGRSRTAAGPTVDKLFRNAEKMSQVDLQTLADFADMLAEKNRPKSCGEK